jgi:Cu-processing system permease protein
VSLIIIPLVSIIFGTVYLYNNKDFIVLILSQPIKRSVLYLGLYLGLVIPLSFSFVIGTLVPLIILGNKIPVQFTLLIFLFAAGLSQTIIFVSISFLIATWNENRILGLGLSIFTWLVFSVLYDGLLLLIINVFQSYPLEKALIGFSIFNPVDLARIIVILKLDVAALMGYTGAVFQKFFNTNLGIIISIMCLIGWTVVPLIIGKRKFSKKDF